MFLVMGIRYNSSYLVVYLSLYNGLNVTRAVIGTIRVQIHGWRHGKLVFFVLFNVASGFENVGEIISDQASESLEKRLAGAIWKQESMEKRRQKEFLTTWECLNCR